MFFDTRKAPGVISADIALGALRVLPTKLLNNLRFDELEPEGRRFLRLFAGVSPFKSDTHCTYVLLFSFIVQRQFGKNDLTMVSNF